MSFLIRRLKFILILNKRKSKKLICKYLLKQKEKVKTII
jgi:hypothetical protein